ncbi:hypothetical protein [Paenibacillus sp. GCM10027626]|uniref:hypothetical protein n=1 Tax=Paenibacillus sp. GCM10027626 TaxID=3273411 RepID=UPI003635A025
MFCVITCYYTFITTFIKRWQRSTASSLLTAAAISCGTATVGGVLLQLVTMLTNPYATVASFNAGIALNYILVIATFLLGAASIWTGKKQTVTRSQLIYRVSAGLIWLTWMGIMANWHFFHFI